MGRNDSPVLSPSICFWVSRASGQSLMGALPPAPADGCWQDAHDVRFRRGPRNYPASALRAVRTYCRGRVRGLFCCQGEKASRHGYAKTSRPHKRFGEGLHSRFPTLAWQLNAQGTLTRPRCWRFTLRSSETFSARVVGSSGITFAWAAALGAFTYLHL